MAKKKKTKEIKLNKKFSYVLAIVSIFLAVKSLEGMLGITGAIVGASQTDITLISFGSFVASAFLAIFAVNQIMKK